jgi:hypothetical protein
VKKIPLMVAIALLIGLLVVLGKAENVKSFCDLETPQRARVFDWSTWQTSVIQDRKLFFEPFDWDASDTIWQGYHSDRPFDQPTDVHKRWSITLIQASGAEQWIYILNSPSTPNTNYVYVFQTVKPFADSRGEHFGYHPCRAFAAAAPLVRDWINRVYHIAPEPLGAEPLITY